MSENSKKIQIILWLALAAVVIGIGGYVIGLRKGQNSNETTEAATEAVVTTEEQTEEVVTEAETEAATEAATEEKKTDKASEGDAELLYATVSSGASWPVDKGYEFQYDIKIQNNSDEEYENWKVEVEGFKDAKIDNSWNAKYEIKDGVLIITPESHNGKIGAHSAVGDLGVQVIFDSEDAGKKVSIDTPIGGEEDELTLGDTLADVAPSAESILMDKELLGALYDEINRLDPDGRRICALIMQGKTEREIAADMGKCQSTINYQKNKVFSILREALKNLI